MNVRKKLSCPQNIGLSPAVNSHYAPVKILTDAEASQDCDLQLFWRVQKTPTL